jgi:hypothetical protein
MLREARLYLRSKAGIRCRECLPEGRVVKILCARGPGKISRIQRIQSRLERCRVGRFAPLNRRRLGDCEHPGGTYFCFKPGQLPDLGTRHTSQVGIVLKSARFAHRYRGNLQKGSRKQQRIRT